MPITVARTGHDMCILISLVFDKIHGGFRELTERVGHVISDATPQIAGLESSHLEGCDDSKVVQATSESNPKLMVLFVVCANDLAGCKHDLEFRYRIASESPTCRVE
jgi:hypothetical protein